MKIIFRVDASIEIGFGHVMRCLSLAKVLKNNGSNVQFICRNHPGNLIGKIRSNGFDVIELNAPSNIVDDKLFHSSWLGETQKKDAIECVEALQFYNVNWIIVDHYGIDEEWQERLKPHCVKLMVIDDLADRRHLCDILLDQTFARKKRDYKGLILGKCVVLLGSQYALLRLEFSIHRKYSLERRSKFQFKRLFINFGGVDFNNMTGEILKEVGKCNLPKDLNVLVVVGKGSPHLKSIEAQSKLCPYKTIVKVDVDNIAEIMSNSDIAIGAAGSTAWERCCLGLPTIQMVISKNQSFSANMLAENHIVKPLKRAQDISLLLENLNEWLEPVRNKSKNFCDGLGSYRVFNRMSDCSLSLKKIGRVQLCNYINLNMNDKDTVMNMRNHIEIKRWMHNKNVISKKEHLDFIQQLEDDISRRYFLVKKEGKIVGSINFSNINLDNSAEFGIYTNPFEKIKYGGLILEESASFYVFNELKIKNIKLKVLTNNKRAIDFYKKCNFKKDKGKSNKEVLYMKKSDTFWNKL